MNNWIWQDEKKLKWWLSILLSANHVEKSVLIRGVLVECKRGQCVKSLDTWAKEWRTDKATVQRFLKTLQKDSMITLENVTVTTRITVSQYSVLNDSHYEVDNADATKLPTRTKRGHTPNNNDKEGKEEIKGFVPPSVHEVECYFTENGYSVEAAQRAHEHYRLAKWHDTKGNPVLAWKQKMHTNWFKPENKIVNSLDQKPNIYL